MSKYSNIAKEINMKNKPTKALTPSQIVNELDKYIIGQTEAKRAVAIALRNRWRRQQIPDKLGKKFYRIILF